MRDLLPSDLSTGMKRSVAIARALSAQPECVLYDEPTTMVDPIMSDILAQLMLKLKHDLKLTAVVVTHDLKSAFMVGDRFALLDQGRIRFSGTAEGGELKGTSQAVGVGGPGAYLGHAGEVVQPEHPWTAKRANSSAKIESPTQPS